MKTLLFVFSLLITSTAFGQGNIKGNITDSETGEPLMDVNIVIPSLSKGGITDWEGNFVIPQLPAGSYDLLINLPEYHADTIKNVSVRNGETTEVSQSMEPEGEIMELDFAITAEKERGSEEAVIQEVREKEEVVTAVGSEQISKSQDRNAAQVMQRIPGVTLIDGRFVMVRGLSQRYNNVMVNGMIAPSTEPDSRAFSFDVISSSMVDRMLVFKSGSAELPGEFAGSVIQIYTKNTVDEDYFKVGFTGGYRVGTTFQNFIQPAGETFDFAGFGAGARELPDDFPDDQLRGIYGEELMDISRLLENNWGTQNYTALPDLRLKFELGKKWEWGVKKLSTVNSLSYSNTNINYVQEMWDYNSFNPDSGKSQREEYYNDDIFVNSVRTALISNWTLELNHRNKIHFNNLFNQMGYREYIYEEGEIGPEYAPRFDQRNYALHYVGRFIYNGQLVGDHTSKNENTNYKWMLGYSNVNRSEPDFRRARTQRRYGTDNDFETIIPPGATIQDAGRFYGSLNEHTFSNSVSAVHTIEKEDTSEIKIRGGYYGEYKTREYASRWLSYVRSNANDFDNDILKQPLTQIFAPENINPNTLQLTEGTNPEDTYDAQSTMIAGYLGFNYPLKSFKFSGGLRTEYFNQQLDTYDGTYDPWHAVDRTNVNLLPFAGVGYQFSEKALARMAYSSTVNRPYFRELAPFSYYDFILKIDVVGNPELQSAKIHNLDLRTEFYPSEGEFIALGAFYKYFQTPIEQVITGAQNPVFSFTNAEYATNYGLELEIRKSFRDVFSSSVLQNFSILFNGAIIESQVNLSDSVAYGNATERALQGQSPYIINTGLYYADEEDNWMISLLYNIYGPRIFLVGNQDRNTQYELPRHSLDLTVSRNISENFEVKLGMTNILDFKYRIYQDSNNDAEIDTSVDEPIRTWNRGQYITLGASYTF